ncbi:MAG: flagellar protein FlgN [Betaproteobacteria bacterium]
MTPLPSTLDALLAAENAGYATLIELLHDETRALCAGDVGVLERHAATKLEQVRALERLFAERQRLATRHAPANVARTPDAGAALERLQQRAAEAKRINALNGRLIDRHQYFASRSLAALRGAAGQPALYGADGQAAHAPAALSRATA